MSIWEYSDDPVEVVASVTELRACLFCSSTLIEAARDNIELPAPYPEADRTSIRLCSKCGWWSAHRREKTLYDVGATEIRNYGAYGVLKNLDMGDLSTPLSEVRDYLAAKYDARFHLHPRLFEETVASIFADLGYSVEVTAYSGDGGIDVVLQNSDTRVGVQVKRYRNAIEVDQIRAFVGALVISDYTKGVFVTTSRFRSGATKAAATAGCRGYPIELVDATKLYEVLGVAQGKSQRSPDEWLEIVHPRLKRLSWGIYPDPYYLF